MKKKQLKFMLKATFWAMVIVYGITSLWMFYFLEPITDIKKEVTAIVENPVKVTDNLPKAYILTPEIAGLICNEKCEIDSCLHNKEILIVGTVLRRNQDIDKTPYLILKVGDMDNIGCYMKQLYNDIKNGDKVMLKGIYRQFAFNNIVITDAELL
ncbi:hypothetical protein E6C50_00475 [Flavobacterium supellecticarium]|uniref:tRNA_anti-like n=1 Tax=Flavobacterium supellecticarium TaxID=2565924 RepID=A0A4S4A2W3_9FLAO|nr:hypothetical protein [Flavobacterium supellecticarium]THF52721.1 hypothetical protein E6C50_00475 [Flavobacterium supellecticarium]